jgi:HPt (histidine-containing phosphotransfer) domain-containing protein
MNEVIREFLLETHENLAELDADLIALEQDPTGRETLARAFRTLHTVKGTAGFLGFVRLQSLAHAAEISSASSGPAKPASTNRSPPPSSPSSMPSAKPWRLSKRMVPKGPPTIPT